MFLACRPAGETRSMAVLFNCQNWLLVNQTPPAAWPRAITPRSLHTEFEIVIQDFFFYIKKCMPLKEKPCIKSQGVKTFEQNEDVYIFLLLPKYHIFSFSTAIYLVLPRLLMHGFLSGAYIFWVSVWIFCNSCKWVPQLSSVWKDGSQNHTVIVGKGSNTQKYWKTK